MDPINPSPTRPRLAASPSPSRSPSRRQEQNHLLSDLSPSSTLEALQANDVVRTGGKAGNSFLQDSIATASTSERAWGIKAALAGKKVREWYAEIGGWAWPGFDQPLMEEPSKGRDQHHKEGHIDRELSSEATNPGASSFFGKNNVQALSSTLIQEYEERIEKIRDDMEALEIEDLKDYVRNTHFRAGSRRSSLHDPQATCALATDYDHLDDFTTVITAVIVQALPTISRLETLLNTWSTRLLVLRQVPSFLVDLIASRESMISASMAIGAHDLQHPKRRLDFSPKAFSDIRAVLQDQIVDLGKRLDRMLDLLEGSADTLPEAWVDALDNIENQYSAWVVKAEWLAMNKQTRSQRLEKDYTRDHSDKLLDLDSPLNIGRSTSTLDIGVQLDDIRRRADNDYDSTRPAPIRTVKSETSVNEFSTKSSAGISDPFPSGGALPEQGHGIKAQPRWHVVNVVDRQSLDGPSNGLETSSVPITSSHRPSPLIFASPKENVKRPKSSDAASDGCDSGSTTSNYSSNKSSPEIQSAVVAEYIGSPTKATNLTSLNEEPMTTSDTSFQRSSQQPEDGRMPSDLMSKKLPRNGGPDHVKTRRASFQSFEVVPKYEIRRIQVQRSGSHSSTFSLSDREYGPVKLSRSSTSAVPEHGEQKGSCTTTPLSVSANVDDLQSSPSARNLDSGHDIPRPKHLYHTPPPVSVKSSLSTQSSDREMHKPKNRLPYHTPPAVLPRSAHSVPSLDRELDMAEHRTSYHLPPPVPSRPAHRFEQIADLGRGSAPVKIRQMRKSDSTSGHAARPIETSRTTGGLSPSNFHDQLEERISSILTELPTQIRLTSGPELDAPEVTRFNSPSNPKTPNIRSPAWRLRGTQTSTSPPSMTLAPAHPKNSESRSLTGEPDIKLYHLHQAGKTAPIKLFVRLVGEGGERVMVRIGGGWADLGEYLREYAGHHGRRSVSDTPFDIAGLPSSSPVTNNQTPRSRPGSRPDTPNSSTKHTPATRLAKQRTSPAMVEGPNTPQSDPLLRSSPRLSWAATDEVSPSLGLAGPKTKNVDISPSKQAWVDGMLEQARQSGAEKKGGGESAVGELGKVGSTRRIFFKNKKEG
ncbi:hypothetical protein IMSHALPRED_003996 [Imshaugia aleurites]|uniref:GAR domain-containing protein n=1 Tax=Imshaugia aleurites TaxID=172621 RepID=A0A8H3EJX0_9LECA|nr:hypothetical protein IMSHALPRED_003996 [Imshaugia aleurites]